MSSDKKITKRKTFDLRLTRSELVHLRDLFGVMLPQELKVTISQSLAKCEGRQMLETRLWGKVTTACENANIPMNEESPDFTVSAVSNPTLEVFQIAREDDQEEESSDDHEVADDSEEVEDE